MDLTFRESHWARPAQSAGYLSRRSQTRTNPYGSQPIAISKARAVFRSQEREGRDLWGVGTPGIFAFAHLREETPFRNPHLSGLMRPEIPQLGEDRFSGEISETVLRTHQDADSPIPPPAAYGSAEAPQQGSTDCQPTRRNSFHNCSSAATAPDPRPLQQVRTSW